MGLLFWARERMNRVSSSGWGWRRRQYRGGLQCTLVEHVGGCQNYGPFLGTLNSRCRIIIGTQKGTLILTTTHMYFTDPATPLNPETERKL